MLSALLLTMLAQSGECRFAARWMLPISVEVAELGSIVRVTELPAPMAEVVVTNDGAAIALSAGGTRLKVFVQSLPVSTKAPLAFGHGLQTVESSLLIIKRVDGAFVEVIPRLPSGSSVSFEWKSQRVACADLQLGRLPTSSACELASLYEFSSIRGGPIDWKVAHTKAFPMLDGAVEVSLLDGSVVRGWSKPGSGVSYKAATCFECFGLGRGGPSICPRTVPLFSSSGAKVGELQAGTSFAVVSKSDQWVEIFTEAEFEQLKFSMKREDFEHCGD